MLLALLTACTGPMLYPPPGLRAVDLTPPDEGELRASAGAALLLAVQEAEVAPALDLYGGLPSGGLALGLPHGLDVGLATAALWIQQQPSLGGHVGWTPLRSGRHRAGFALGVAGVGQQVQVDEVIHPAGSVAPSLMLRYAWTPDPRFELPVALRWSHAIGLVDGEVQQRPPLEWVELATGPVLRSGPLRAGLDLGLVTAVGDGPAVWLVYPRIGVSVAVEGALWTPTRRAAAGAPRRPTGPAGPVAARRPTG